MRKRIHLPGTVHLIPPGDLAYPLSKPAAKAGKHALAVGDAAGGGGVIVGTLDELAVHVGEAASVIFKARADVQGVAAHDDRAIVIDHDKLTAWATEWSENEYGSWGMTGAASDIVDLVTALNDRRPDDTGWRTHPEVKAVVASATDDDAVIAALDVAAGFRISTIPQETWDLRDEDLRGGDLAAQIASQIAALLNEGFAAYRTAR